LLLRATGAETSSVSPDRIAAWNGWLERQPPPDFSDQVLTSLRRWIALGASGPFEGSNRVVSWLNGSARNDRGLWWRDRGAAVGDHLHRLGLLVGLRTDDPANYNDESNYSSIEIGESTERGERVKYLKLDKLMHSYFNPSRPVELYYEYERIYAAVTELAVGERETVASIPFDGWPLPELPTPAADNRFDWDDEPDEAPAVAEVPGEPLPEAGAAQDNEPEARPAQRLPEWVVFDADRKRLEVRGGMSDLGRRELLSVSPMWDWWALLDDLHERTTRPEWGGFESISTPPPPGVVVPETLIRTLRYDPLLQAVNVFAPVTADARKELVAAGPHAGFHDAVDALYARSRQASALFIGGGGYVFPRWIEARFPYRPRIDVAELDPAVTLAVERKMGLAPAGKSAVHTWNGDARNFVDDCLRRNARLAAAGKPPVVYDFVYGDAFNDFSVPWHLTTREFSEKVASLLTEDGAYLINLIDILPRTEHPGTTAPVSTVRFAGTVPQRLAFDGRVKLEWAPLLAPAELVSARRLDVGTTELRFDGRMSDDMLSTLHHQAGENAEFRAAVHALHEATHAPQPFVGRIPTTLLPTSPGWDWQRCPAPFESLQVLEVAPPGDAAASTANDSAKAEPARVLGFRGAMPDATRDALLRLEPSNEAFATAVNDLHRRSRGKGPGRFLGRYVHTLCAVFPNVYVFSSEVAEPHDDRDTFVIVASKKPLAMDRLERHSDFWHGRPFAARETDPSTGSPADIGQMAAVRELAQGIELTDDHAPVDNLLVPVFARQE